MPGRRRALAAFRQHRRRADWRRLVGTRSARLRWAATAPRRGERWIRASAVSDLKPNVPVPKVLAVSRVDGWYRERARETVFLVWDGDQTVRASRPPARTSAVRCDGTRPTRSSSAPATAASTMPTAARCRGRRRVRSIRSRRASIRPPTPCWCGCEAAVRLDSRPDRIPRRRRGDARRAAAAGHRLVLHARQRAPGAAVDSAPHRRIPHALLRADARSRVRQRPLHQPTTAGRMVRGLHHFGASFIVVAMVLHMLRVIAFGSYKPPREVTWLSGLVLLALILAFALTGYLLPWDQRAYWATVVTINISKLTPLARRDRRRHSPRRRDDRRADADALVRRARHLPAVRARAAGRGAPVPDAPSRHLRPGTPTHTGRSQPFYPVRPARDSLVVSAVLALLARVGLVRRAAARRSGGSDRCELRSAARVVLPGLFQLLKYFPGQMGSRRRDGGARSSRRDSSRCCRGSIAGRSAIRGNAGG